MNWAMWVLVVLVAIGALGSSIPAKPTASTGNRTPSPTVAASLSSGTPTTRSALSASSHTIPATIKAPAPRPTIKAPAPRPTIKPTAPRLSTAPAPPPSSPLTCIASMSNPNPADYTTTDVIVHTGVPGATVTATAHYKTTDTTHSGIAAGNGVADIAYYISGATPGYTVTVDVTVTAQGASKYCSTKFIPHR